MSGVVEESLSPGEVFSGNDCNSQSFCASARIIRRCSGPETAFNNISNNGGATIGCVIEVETGRPLTCQEVFSVIENLYNKYEILRLRFVFKQKVSHPRFFILVYLKKLRIFHSLCSALFSGKPGVTFLVTIGMLKAKSI